MKVDKLVSTKTIWLFALNFHEVIVNLGFTLFSLTGSLYDLRTLVWIDPLKAKKHLKNVRTILLQCYLKNKTIRILCLCSGWIIRIDIGTPKRNTELCWLYVIKITKTNIESWAANFLSRFVFVLYSLMYIQ